MHIIHEATIEHPDGIVDISIIVVNEPNTFKKYTYHLKSKYIAEKFHTYYRMGRGMHRSALALLNKHNTYKEVER
jgi:hypothetical protein